MTDKPSKPSPFERRRDIFKANLDREFGALQSNPSTRDDYASFIENSRYVKDLRQGLKVERKAAKELSSVVSIRKGSCVDIACALHEESGRSVMLWCDGGGREYPLLGDNEIPSTACGLNPEAELLRRSSLFSTLQPHAGNYPLPTRGGIISDVLIFRDEWNRIWNWQNVVSGVRVLTMPLRLGGRSGEERDKINQAQVDAVVVNAIRLKHDALVLGIDWTRHDFHCEEVAKYLCSAVAKYSGHFRNVVIAVNARVADERVGQACLRPFVTHMSRLAAGNSTSAVPPSPASASPPPSTPAATPTTGRSPRASDKKTSWTKTESKTVATPVPVAATSSTAPAPKKAKNRGSRKAPASPAPVAAPVEEQPEAMPPSEPAEESKSSSSPDSSAPTSITMLEWLSNAGLIGTYSRMQAEEQQKVTAAWSLLPSVQIAA